ALPITGTIDAPPALGQPSPTETASAGQADTEAAGGSGGADSADATSAADGSNASGADPGAGTGADSADQGAAGTDTHGDPNHGGDEPDDRCEATPDPGKPCEIDGELNAGWNPTTKVLKVDPSDLPESWVGKTFDGPT